ncbi:MAG: nitroreductase family deazaflavin-dependent oxidoreductase [Mycobacterium sp.]|mgnify:CR=1 FL=1|nr:nitroreductase family deazaflavin-dependent oxidoreductase [Mycobacterium sp.]
MSALADRAVGLFVRVHDATYQRTRGWIGHRVPGAPNSLLLHTVGAKTGLPRTNSLSYARDGEAYLVVASNGGDRRAPGWYHNLRAQPRAEINVGPRRFAVTAKVVLPDDPDYQRLWRIVNANNANRYDAYQARTTRPIPVIRLTP